MKQILAFAGAGLFAVSSQATVLLDETFTYADGDLTNVAAPLWNYHSGGGTPTTALNVVGGQAFINQNDATSGGGDANRLLSSTFDPATDNTSAIYVGFTVNFSALPFNSGASTAGSYFAHLKSSAANEFYGRIGANQEGAAPGTFRLAITTESWPATGAGTVEFGQDLSLGINYLVVMKYDLSTDQATLWVDPTSEASTSVVSTDAPSYAAGVISAFALRQGTSNSTGAPGDIFVDDLKVATSFGEVIPVPEPGSLAILICGAFAALVAKRRRN